MRSTEKQSLEKVNAHRHGQTIGICPPRKLAVVCNVVVVSVITNLGIKPILISFLHTKCSDMRNTPEQLIESGERWR